MTGLEWRLKLGGVSLAILAFTAPMPAQAESFRIAPGPVAEVIAQLGRQAGATIVLADPRLAGRHSPGIRAKASLASALRQALRGTEAEAVFITPSVVRIQTRRMPAAHPQPRPQAPAAQPSVGEDILVRASKLGLALDDYPGSAKVVRIDQSWAAAQASDGSAALTRLSPALTATNLGRGRNKLFVRGIADSSFSGPTQTTTGEYLGDVRLTYSAPDPDLNLQDMQSIEVLAGPQGTLYGSGSLGGIIRVVPNTPSMKEFSVAASTGLGFTQYGDASFDGAATINVPLGTSKALRAVLYGGRAGGYIDAPEQGRRNINATTNYGQRVTLRLEDLGGWTVEIGSVLQNFQSGDGQYVLRGEPKFTRSGNIAQPYENNYRLGFVTAKRPVAGMTLTGVASYARQELSTLFNATGYDGTEVPARLKEDQSVTLFSQEVRLAGGNRAAPWMVGFALVRSVNRRKLSIGPLSRWSDSAGLEDDQLETALFAQISRPVLPGLTATGGLRLTGFYSRRRVIDVDVDGLEGRTGNTRRVSGTIGLVWRPAPFTSLFADYRQGYRPGGLGFTISSEGVKSTRFAPDDLRMIEMGVRWGNAQTSPVSLQAALFLADWRNVQADLIGASAIPYTTNIGRGVIRGLDAELAVRLGTELRLGAAAFLNQSRLTNATDALGAETAGKEGYVLPNVPRHGGRISATWERQLNERARLRMETTFRYVGASRLGVGSYLDIRQGGYLAGDLSVGIIESHKGLSIDLTNFMNSRGNTFSYGNPFGVSARDQMTPLRPRTLKLNFQASF